MTDQGMPMPDWADEARRQMYEAHGSIDYQKGGVEVRNLDKILHFSTHFAEYLERDSTIVVHLFPRGGAEDRYYAEELRDGKRIPGRLELHFSKIEFPNDMESRIQDAADRTWAGDIAIEEISVLRYEDEDEVVRGDNAREHRTGTFVVQFQEAVNAAHLIGTRKFVDKFCEELDKELEG